MQYFPPRAHLLVCLRARCLLAPYRNRSSNRSLERRPLLNGFPLAKAVSTNTSTRGVARDLYAIVRGREGESVTTETGCSRRVTVAIDDLSERV